jgi:hypothetical protein
MTVPNLPAGQTGKVKKGSFAAAYPLSPDYVDGIADMGGKKGPPRAARHLERPKRSQETLWVK